MFSQFSGIALIFGTPYSIILFQRATQEASGSALRHRLINRAIGVQALVMIGAYYSYKSTLGALDKYSAKYLSGLDDQALLNFEKQDPKAINQKANAGNVV